MAKRTPFTGRNGTDDGPKICVLGLDGATWDMLDPWLDDLPTINTFAETLHVTLDSSIPPISVPAWKCYSTGLDPGQLGVFTFVEPDFEVEQFKTVRSETFTHREIWDYLGDHGYRSAVINMPSTSPPREIPGWMVSGPFSDDDDFAEPKSLQSELANDGYTVIPEYYLKRDSTAIDAAIDAVEQRLDVARRLSRKADFVHVTLYIIDTVQHVEFDSSVAKEFWIEVDRLLGAFFDDLEDDWNVVLMSDHGFGRSAGKFYLNTWLEREGYLQFAENGFDLGDLAGLLGLDYATVFSIVRRLRLEKPLRTVFPAEFLLRVARQMPGNRRLQGLQEKIDWDSDAIALPPLIFTKDRSTAEEIRRELLAVETPRGERIIDDVFLGADLYPDSNARVPDLIVKHTDWDINPVFNPNTVFEENPTEGIIAHHRRNGILSARGPELRPFVGEEARLVDLAPTILDAYGADVPVEMTGRSLELFGSYGRRVDVPIDRGADRRVEHDEEVEQKLKNLGYL